MSTSPEPVRGRVLRGGVASTASSLAFPTIDVVVAPRGRAATPAEPAPIPATPQVDPAELERVRLDAAARGYEDGFAAGRADAGAELRRLVDALGAAVEDQQRRVVRSCDELTDQVAEVAYAVVEEMLGRELALATRPVRDAVRRALRLAPERSPAVVLVHPGDVDLLAEDDTCRGRAVEVVADPSVPKGACVVRVGDCEIDGRHDAAMERLRAVLQQTEVSP
jgi:flagellar assembly protein FliH